MRIDVESYSGFKNNERPRRFRLGESWLEVKDVIDQWYSPEATWFRVLASDNNVYVIKAEDDNWMLERAIAEVDKNAHGSTE
jgi:hypothetical protein